MDEILQYLLAHASFLYKEFGFRFVDSAVSDSFGGDAYLILANDKLRMRLVRDRDQLFADFQCSDSSGGKEWFSIDIVRRFLTGEREYFAELDASNARFLRERLRGIEEAFDPVVFDATQRELHRLEKERSKFLFG